ncbi:RNA polymerase sigma factor RpoH [Alphaproteobacteria bacterium]|nr:RNA polymerase sigma factor RpoH [Alphaproteobacteria bacterium]
MSYNTLSVINNFSPFKTNNFVASSGQIGLRINGDEGFLRYLRAIQKFAILSKEEEEYHTKNYFENKDNLSAKILVESHLRLVVKIAHRFKNYGLPLIDLVSEGNLGLIQALKKFQPQKGFRFSTYAMWWIRAFIQDFVLRSWSLVKIGTTTAQKKLFFNLHKIKRKLGLINNNFADSQALNDDNIEKIAQTLNVKSEEVKDMDSRLNQSDYSINHQINNGENDSIEIGDLIESDQKNQEQIAIENQDYNFKKQIFAQAFAKLNDREQDIIQKRQLNEEGSTLEDLSKFYKISRERIRQIEENAIKKIKKEIAEILQKKLANS